MSPEALNKIARNDGWKFSNSSYESRCFCKSVKEDSIQEIEGNCV